MFASRRTRVTHNIVHENGIFGMQSSPYFQAIAAESLIENNVFFNGPRAGINFNDGFGGGNVVRGNLVFNMVYDNTFKDLIICVAIPVI